MLAVPEGKGVSSHCTRLYVVPDEGCGEWRFSVENILNVFAWVRVGRPSISSYSSFWLLGPLVGRVRGVWVQQARLGR